MRTRANLQNGIINLYLWIIARVFARIHDLLVDIFPCSDRGKQRGRGLRELPEGEEGSGSSAEQEDRVTDGRCRPCPVAPPNRDPCMMRGLRMRQGSEQGMARVRLNKPVQLPHFNPFSRLTTPYRQRPTRGSALTCLDPGKERRPGEEATFRLLRCIRGVGCWTTASAQQPLEDCCSCSFALACKQMQMFPRISLSDVTDCKYQRGLQWFA